MVAQDPGSVNKLRPKRRRSEPCLKMTSVVRRLAAGGVGQSRALLFVPVFLIALVLIVPSLIRGMVPVRKWPAAVFHALLH
jgi:hypothetical protein